jgi:hypothetical protein
VGRDFKEARKRAREAADEAVGDKLDAILQVADQLEDIFDELELSDKDTYDGLTEIVRDATEKNESIAAVIERVKALGEVGQELAVKITEITSAGALAAVRGALNV